MTLLETVRETQLKMTVQRVSVALQHAIGEATVLFNRRARLSQQWRWARRQRSTRQRAHKVAAHNPSFDNLTTVYLP